MRIGDTLAEIALGMHNLERSGTKAGDLLDEEGFIAISCGGDRVRPDNFATWVEVEHRLDQVKRETESVADGHRKTLLEGMIKSMSVAGRFYAGEDISFAQIVQDVVGGIVGPVPADRIGALRDSIESRMAEADVSGSDFASRLANWKQARLMDKRETETAFRDLMAVAKQRTDRLVFNTGDYDMALNWYPDLPFGARCDFINRKMDLNPEMRFTRAEIKHLVCHEVYPGHSTQLLFTTSEVDAGRTENDALLCAANALNGCVLEGIGDQGIKLIDWVEDVDDEIVFELTRLRNAARTTAAWHLMEEKRGESEIAGYLQSTCAASPASIKAFWGLAKHPYRGAFVSSYWTGSEAVGEVLATVSRRDRRRFSDFLIGQLQSPDSLRLFH
jgi:hypothetical protein